MTTVSVAEYSMLRIKTEEFVVKTRSRILKSDEIYSIVMALRAPYNIITLFQLYTGLSIGEILSLETQDVYDRNGKPLRIISIPNRRRSGNRFIEIPEPLLRILEQEHKPGEKWVFTSSQEDRPIHSDIYRYEIKRVCRELNIQNVTPHCFRRTALLRLYESGKGLKELKNISGHVRTDHLIQCLGIQVSPKIQKQTRKNYKRT